MAGGARERRRRRVRPDVTTFHSRTVAIVASLALLVQLLVIPYHQASSAPLIGGAAPDVAAVAAELRATFGEAATLCVQSDGKSDPGAPAGDCDDHCPLCRFAAEAATLITPDAPALPERFEAVAEILGTPPETGAIPPRPDPVNRARAPPFVV